MNFPPFEDRGVRQIIPRQALTIINVVATRLDIDPEIVIFPTDGIETSWICFNMGDRKFGIWKTNLYLYEADENGAMGEDEINPETVKPYGGYWVSNRKEVR